MKLTLFSNVLLFPELILVEYREVRPAAGRRKGLVFTSHLQEEATFL